MDLFFANPHSINRESLYKVQTDVATGVLEANA